jgi:hypothetical protein
MEIKNVCPKLDINVRSAPAASHLTLSLRKESVSIRQHLRKPPGKKTPKRKRTVPKG